MFVMMQVLAKTNAARLSLAERGEHHEKQTRTIGSTFGEVDVVKTQISDIEDKLNTQTSTDDVMNNMADMLNTGVGKQM